LEPAAAAELTDRRFLLRYYEMPCWPHHLL